MTMLSTVDRLPRNFIKTTISARLKCPICFEVYFKPRRLYCGHTFCKPCLQQLCNKQHHKNPEYVNTCPLCRTQIDFGKVGYDHFALRIINELQVACPVYGCPWKGENQLLDSHYNNECKMKTYVKKLAKGAKEFDFDVEEYQEKDDDLMEKLNENVQKGSLISRVVSKNPHLLNAIENTPIERMNEPKRPKLITCGIQTDPVKVIPLRRHKIRKEIQPLPTTEQGVPQIAPVNGFDPIPNHILKKKPKNLATRIKQENRMSAASSSEQYRNMRELYDDMGVNYLDETDRHQTSEPSVVDIDV